MAPKWTAERIPDQRGRVAVVTGANSGLGLSTARELARAGAKVVVAVRDTHKGQQAAAEIKERVPGADVPVAELDLASLASVRQFASGLQEVHPTLDLLINNAGVMAAPRRTTPEGFESHFATNHLGHFALTGILLGNLLSAQDPRVVTVSSDMHRTGKIDFEDLQGERSYNRWGAYSQSKLANLLFCFELDRRARAANSRLKSVAAHPGYAATNLQFAGPTRLYERAGMWIGNLLFAQSADMGALPTLYAATAEDLASGSFVGPDGFRGQRGHPHLVTAAGKAYDEEVARRLWEVSEELSGVTFSFGVAEAHDPA
jgi:NAD(P)-dependent dehydrogenase (short-subunit alcohol dehydrogenase family)